ncbi:MAG: phage tail protein [Pseudomonadota bacterium]
MMMGFGQFTFSLETLAYQQLERAAEWRHPSNSLVGAAPASQFTGPGDDTTTLNGTLHPAFKGDPQSLDLLREMANSGKAWPLVSGTGRVYGAYVITSLREAETNHLANGTPTRIDFTLMLKRVDDGATDQLGTQTSAAG